jgi:hypothetical protein
MRELAQRTEQNNMPMWEKKSEREKGLRDQACRPPNKVQGNSPPQESNGTVALSDSPISGSLEGPDLRPFQGSQFRATSVFPRSGASSHPGMLPA